MDTLLKQQIGDTKNATMAADALLGKIGRQGANRLRQELIDDAKEQAYSILFKKMQILTEKFLECKVKSKKCLKTYRRVCTLCINMHARGYQLKRLKFFKTLKS
jgi:hypothetical protein